MSALVRVWLLLILGLVVLWRGLMYLNDRLGAMGRPDASAAAAPAPAATPAPALPAGPAPPAALPPPTEGQILALRVGDPRARWDALVAVRRHAVTPELLEALDDTARQVADFPEVLQLISCHRARAEGASLDIAFDALPSDPHDVAWDHEGVMCLMDLIGTRAAESPERATAVLAERAVRDPSPKLREALARLDLPELPEAIVAAANDRTSSARRRRVAAVEAAIAMGAVTKWPDLVRAWVDDAESLVSATAVRALAARTDEASQAIVAVEIATRPETGYLKALADHGLLKPGTLDLQLVAVAADLQQPAFARGNAVRLVGGRGGEEACRRLARLEPDADIQADLARAYADIDQRFGAGFRAEARR